VSRPAPATRASSRPVRIAELLGLKDPEGMSDVELALRVAEGFRPGTADRLAAVLGRPNVIGPLIPEATLRRAKRERKRLSREMSERLYEVGRVLELVRRVFHDDPVAIERFLGSPHPLLGDRTPLALAGTRSAGADAVVDLVRRADAGVAV
jgi:putative toxin-antitoxin system antitoxin component (TIGR02293 family)